MAICGADESHFDYTVNICKQDHFTVGFGPFRGILDNRSINK